MELERTGAREVIVPAAGIAGTATDPDIVQLNDGRLLMVWTEATGAPTDMFDDADGAVFGQFLNASGTLLGDIFQVNPFEDFAQIAPEAMALPDGGYAITWETDAIFGDTSADPDILAWLFTSDGRARTGGPIDVGSDTAPSTAARLAAFEPLSANRLAVVRETGDTFIYNTSSQFREFLEPPTGLLGGGATSGKGDILQLDTGNIVSAIPIQGSGTGDVVAMRMVNQVFEGVDRIPGAFGTLVFDSIGDPTQSKDDVHLTTLAGGGFALSYIESRPIIDPDGVDGPEPPIFSSTLRLEIFTDYGAKTGAMAPIELPFAFDDPRAHHDLLGLEGGGIALAFTTADGPDAGTDTDVLLHLYNADGSREDSLPAGATRRGDQDTPALLELNDGTVALAFTDASGTVIGGEDGPLHLSFFDVTGATGRFRGTDGADTLAGIGGDDRLIGLGGNDDLRGRGGNDTIRGDDGDDRLRGDEGRDGLRGGAGNDTLEGGAGNDGLGGGTGADRLLGDGGNDVLGGGSDSDRLFGGAGNDHLKGQTGSDVLLGQSGDDTLRGGPGNDNLSGGAGDDRIFGNDGADTLDGGTGADLFVFSRSDSGTDTILNFDASEDVIVLKGIRASDVSVARAGRDTEINAGGDVILLDGVRLDRDDITFDFA